MRNLLKPLVITSILSLFGCLAITSELVAANLSQPSVEKVGNHSISNKLPLVLVQTAGVDRALVVQQLLEKHAEKPVGMGIAANGHIIELFTSPDGSTWTLIMTSPNGKSVMLGSGEYWAGAPINTFQKGEKI
tara:strand:+ start:7617 stop:8015 length:399 start_codon:yes stop_codon:yes gene_type:complete